MRQWAVWIVVTLALANAAAAIALAPDRFMAGFGWKNLRLLAMVAAVPIVVWALYQPVGLAIRGSTAPLRDLRRITRANAPRLWMVVLVMALFVLNANSVAVFKVAIPRLVPFYADGLFAGMDRLIFGTDPWRITHMLGHRFTVLCDRLYVAWFIALYVGIIALGFATDARKQFVGLLAFSLGWIVLGQICATLLSSAGPILIGDLLADRSFDPLLSRLRETPGLFALGARDRLIAMQSGIGAGISAMPSMHVAMAVYWTLLTRMFFPRLWLIPAVYAALIWIASVHLGWHYAVDGLFSLLGMLALWKLAEAAARLLFGVQTVAAISPPSAMPMP